MTLHLGCCDWPPSRSCAFFSLGWFFPCRVTPELPQALVHTSLSFGLLPTWPCTCSDHISPLWNVQWSVRALFQLFWVSRHLLHVSATYTSSRVIVTSLYSQNLQILGGQKKAKNSVFFFFNTILFQEDSYLYGMCVDEDMDADKNLPGEKVVSILVYLHVEELWWIKKKKTNMCTATESHRS